VAELNDEARALVEAGRSALRPEAGDRARVLEALRTRMAHGGAMQHTSASPRTTTAGSFGPAAVAGIALGVALLGGGAFFALRTPKAEPPSPPTSAPPLASSSRELAPQAPAAVPNPPLLPAATEVDAVGDSAPRTARRPSDRLSEEVAILSRAETELHAGRFASALQVLEEHRRKFPRGTLTQERVAARARALCALGRVTEAQAELGRLSPGSLHEGPAREACPTSAKK
jgi:hypothetical protein